MPIKNCSTCVWGKPNGPFPRMLYDCSRYPQVVVRTIGFCGEYKPTLVVEPLKILLKIK